jgi:ABC-2 type transport system permease protein
MKVLLEYRTSFIIGALSTLFIQLASIMTIWIVMQNVPDLKGWDFEAILLILGIITLSKSLNHMFADNLWSLGGNYVKTGNLDRFLIRPISPLFHLLADRFCHDGIGEMILGLILVIYSITHLNISWPIGKIVFLIFSIAGGGLIFFSINLITCVTSFWIYDSLPFMIAIHETHNFAKYPITIFPWSIKFVATIIIPYAFAGYYPASYLIADKNTELVWAGPLVTIVLVIASYRLWLFGLRHYTSSGF